MLKWFMRPVPGSLVVALVFYAVSSSVFAQLPPPISPWMGMMDKSRFPGQLDPYNRVVKPQQELMKAYADQTSQIQSQQQALQALQGSNSGGSGRRDFLDSGIAKPAGASENMLLEPPREIPSTQRHPAVFNQYLHYYPPYSMPRRPVPNFSQAGRRR